MNLQDSIAQWLTERVTEARSNGIVVGLSGGIDSAVVAALAVKALGQEKVLGVIMPAQSQQQDIDHAHLLAASIGLNIETIDLDQPFRAMLELLPEGNTLAVANIKPRLRMITLYYVANTRNFLVCGTGNRSELMAGYFTKYGDGGVDILPIASLYKHEVRQLARDLNIPAPIIDKPPSAGLWAGQTDEDEIGMSYEELDGILAGLESGDISDYSDEAVSRVQDMIRRSAHKRTTPPMFEIDRSAHGSGDSQC